MGVENNPAAAPDERLFTEIGTEGSGPDQQEDNPTYVTYMFNRPHRRVRAGLTTSGIPGIKPPEQIEATFFDPDGIEQ